MHFEVSMLASSKALLTFWCFVRTYFLYTHDHFSTSPDDYAAAPSATSETIVFDSQPSTPQVALSKNNPSAPAAFVPKNTNSTSDGSGEKQPADFVPKATKSNSNVSKEKRSRILQATMMFGDKYIGLNERILQSHVDRAKRWGYGDYILRREIVGAGQWDSSSAKYCTS